MAGILRTSRKQPNSIDFRASHAVVIGINNYRNDIPPLLTPVNDATRLATLLERDHGYIVHELLNEDAKLDCLETCFTTTLPSLLGPDDRLLVYFAGHGTVGDGDGGPQGFLIPQGADKANEASLLPMATLHEWLAKLPCRHMLAILDCCFAGTFRWAATRSTNPVKLRVIYQERFNRFMRDPAWQVLTSAAYNEQALDVVSGNWVGKREESNTQHSPFAGALFKALAGDGDFSPKKLGDGVITANELILFLDEQLGKVADHQQTPGLWPLKKHGNGQFFFLNPKHLLKLTAAEGLNDDLNPWRGLKAYGQNDAPLYFGRDEAIKKLVANVAVMPFTAVLGASGTGKSSLVKSGLLPRLAAGPDEWEILPPIRPGAHPVNKLNQLLVRLADELPDYTGQPSLAPVVAAWAQEHPGRKLLLVVDQLEELVTLADDTERTAFLGVLAEAVAQQPDAFRLVITLRTDFEPLLKANPGLKPLGDGDPDRFWDSARFIVPPLTRAELREIIEGPAAERVLYFEPPALIDDLLDELDNNPGALPLLSFTLSEMFIQYLKSGRDDRLLTLEDYNAMGRVTGSLRKRANKEYDSLKSAHKATMARVMLRMISVEGGELARRRVPRSELIYPSDAENARVETVLNRLVDARLLVIDEEKVEPAHDALVLAWDQLLRWKKAAEDYLPLQRQTAQAESLWAEAEHKTGLLWDDDPRLQLLEQTLWPAAGKQQGLRGRLRRIRRVLDPDITPPAEGPKPDTILPADTRWINKKELDFVVASVRQRAIFWQGLTLDVVLIFLLLAGITGWALSQRADAVFNANIAATEVVVRRTAEAEEEAARGTAVAERAVAQYQARQSRSRELAALSDQRYLDDPNQSILMAVEAITTTSDIDSNPYTSEAFGALQRRLSSPLLATLDSGSDIISADFDPSRKFIIIATKDEGLQIWDGTKYSPIPSDSSHQEAIDLITFNPAGTRMVTRSEDQVTVWNTNGWEPLHTYAVDRSPDEWPMVSADGRYVAEKTGGQIKVYSTDNRDNQPIEQFDLNQGFREPFAFIDGRDKAHIGLTEGGIQVIDLITGSREPSGLGNEHHLADKVYQAVLPGDPEKKALLITGGSLFFLTPGNREVPWEYVGGGSRNLILQARLSQSGDWALFTMLHDAEAGGDAFSTFMVSTQNEDFPFYNYEAISIDDVIFSAGEKRAIVKLGSGALELVNLESPDTRLQLEFSISHHYDAQTDRLYSIAPDGVLSIWDVGKAALIKQIAGFVGEIQDVGSDGTQLLTVAGTTASLWSLKPGNILHEVAISPSEIISKTGSYEPIREYLLFNKYSRLAPSYQPLFLWKFGTEEPIWVKDLHFPQQTLAISPTGDSFIVTSGKYCRDISDSSCPFELYRINDGSSFKVMEGVGSNIVETSDGSWIGTDGMKAPAFSPDGRYLLVPSMNSAITFIETTNGSELGRLRPKAGDRSYTSMDFPNSTTLEVKDALGGLIRFDLARIATMDSWDEARDNLEISRLTVENDHLCWQIDGLVDSDRCVEGVKDFREPLLDLDNNWERLITLQDDNSLCIHSMVDSSDPDCLSGVNAYHLLDTDPLRILLVRQNGLAVRIDESGTDLPVNCPAVLPGDIDSIVIADVDDSEIRRLNIRYVDKSDNKQTVACDVAFLSEQDFLHFGYSWQRIPNSNRYLLTPRDQQRPFIIRNGDEVIELDGRGDGQVAFHPSDDFLVTGETNGIINLWNSQTGALLHTFLAHSGSIRNLQVNETSIVSSTNNEIRIWRLLTDIAEMVDAAKSISQRYP